MKAGLETPLGPMWISATNDRIQASGWGPAPPVEPGTLLARAVDQVRAYFDGDLHAFDLPLAPQAEGLQARLLTALTEIPFGETRTYGDLAKALGAPAQAIGQACGANPLPVLIPCHRVLAAQSLGGFSAPGGIETKVWLLRHEKAAGLLI